MCSNGVPCRLRIRELIMPLVRSGLARSASRPLVDVQAARQTRSSEKVQSSTSTVIWSVKVSWGLSEPVPSPTHRPSGRTQDPEDRADHQQDDPESPQDVDPENEAQDEQEDAEEDHGRRPHQGPAPMILKSAPTAMTVRSIPIHNCQPS